MGCHSHSGSAVHCLVLKYLEKPAGWNVDNSTERGEIALSGRSAASDCVW